jgi:hypothetical protein
MEPPQTRPLRQKYAREWCLPIKVDGFEKFQSDESLELIIAGPDHGLPTEAQTQKALGFLEHAEKHGPIILDALWTDIQGGDVDSGHWWHAGLEELNENYSTGYNDIDPIESTQDLAQSLVFNGVVMGHQHETAVEVSFSCEWEDEHGISVLVDDDRVIGLGYALDLEPFAGEPWPPKDNCPPVRDQPKMGSAAAGRGER